MDCATIHSPAQQVTKAEPRNPGSEMFILWMVEIEMTSHLRQARVGTIPFVGRLARHETMVGTIPFVGRIARHETMVGTIPIVGRKVSLLRQKLCQLA